MAKNFADIYNDVNDSIALEQKFFIKEETLRGTQVNPVGADFFFSLTGGSVKFQRPLESSPHRSGRHHTSVIRKKTTTEWSLPTFFNINTAVASGITEVDPAIRVLHKSMFGKEDTTTGVKYTTGKAPNVTFTILENGDKWAKQTFGAFVESAEMSFPGDGQAQTTWSGSAKSSNLVGIGKSTSDNSTTNTVILQTDEGKRFRVGAHVMLVKANGTSRSTDTPDGSPRTITVIAGNTITLSGAPLADADGSAADVFLCYYEPQTPVGINEPQVGLVGSITIAGFTALNCVRSATVNCTNNHELQDNCFGEEGLGGNLFIPGGRFTAEVSLEINMNETLLELLNKLRDDISGEAITLILGDALTRHLEISIPKTVFQVPEISVPDTGPIPVTLTGNAYQSGIDQADEISIHYK